MPTNDIDPRTPVLVGAGLASQRFDHATEGVEAVELMRRALGAAAVDGDAGVLLDRVDEIIVAEGIWGYRDPGALVLDGRSPDVVTTLAAVGVLQQTLFTRAAETIATGAAEVVVVCGGEAKWRSLRAQIAGEVATETEQSIDVTPTVRLDPAEEILTSVEIHRGLATPSNQYAVMESAARFADGQSIEDHASSMTALVSAYSAVAATNPNAWTQAVMTAAEVAAAPRISTPYTKPACSQWNVDQASAFILCSVAAARAAGISSDRWVFPHAGIESNLMVPLTERAMMWRSPAIGAAAVALAEAGVAADEHELLEIYSCFPAAVRMQCRELGIDLGRTLTVTGGMHFGGGPLNNFSLQALAQMVPLLRERPTARGLVTSISGMVTKFGAGSWAATPPTSGFRSVDVTDAARAVTEVRAVDADHAGDAVVAGFTVEHVKGAPHLAVVVADTDSGERVVASSDEPDVAEAMAAGEWVGQHVRVDGPVLHLYAAS